MDYPGKVITKTQVTPTQTSATGVWTLDDAASAIKNNNWPVAGVPNPISKSLRFNSADTAYLNRTFSTPTSRNIWTWSGWIKRSALGNTAGYRFFEGGDGTSANSGFIGFGDGAGVECIRFYNRLSSTTNIDILTTAVFRDVSAWYHVVVAYDSAQATQANRLLMYVNGVNYTWSGTAPSSSQTSAINTNTYVHNIGVSPWNTSTYFSGYLTEINFIDGQALTPSSFGMTNPQTGQWIPLKYSGTYGTNGFYLNFKDATSTTTLGYDYSGNANNWTTNNFSVTAGAGNDSLTDVPTPWFAYNTTGDVGGVIRGNYCTLNPLNKNTSGTLSNGNLEWQASTSAVQVVTGTSTIIPSGKTYFELNVVTAAGSGTFYQVGIAPPGKNLTNDIGVLSGQGYAIEDNQASDIRLRLNGTSVTVSTTVQNGDVLQVAVDYATGKLWFGRNNTWYNSSGGTTGNPGAGTNETATISTTTDWFPAVAKYSTGGSYAINFGQRPFAYTPPTGFRSLCTTNLPATAIGFGLTNQGDDYFNAVLYTGNGTDGRVISGVGFAPDLVWVKARSQAYDALINDSVRGTGKSLTPSSTGAEITNNGNGYIGAFTSDGFTLEQGTFDILSVNGNTTTYVAWNWKASGSTVSNTAGTITSTVSANTTAGFSIVTYTGTGANATVGHGLGVAPSMIIGKRRNGIADWMVGHSGVNGGTNPFNYYMLLNTTAAQTADSTAWQNTAPTSTVFYLGSGGNVNSNGATNVMYCFAAVPGYSAFGSYTGNGSTDGPFVYLGFRPRYIMLKKSSQASTTYGWQLYDTSRSPYNQALLPGLWADTSAAEVADVYGIDLLSNGFKVKDSNTNLNASGQTIIYAAFAEFPFQFANAR